MVPIDRRAVLPSVTLEPKSFALLQLHPTSEETTQLALTLTTSQQSESILPYITHKRSSGREGAETMGHSAINLLPCQPTAPPSKQTNGVRLTTVAAEAHDI